MPYGLSTSITHARVGTKINKRNLVSDDDGNEIIVYIVRAYVLTVYAVTIKRYNT